MSKLRFRQVTDGEFASQSELDAVAAAALPVGTVIMWKSGSTPSGFLTCNGQAVSRSTYSVLFALWGTEYGEGDGSTTFNLWDGQGMVPRGVGNQTVNGRLKTGPASPTSVQEDQAQEHGHNSEAGAYDSGSRDKLLAQSTLGTLWSFNDQIVLAPTAFGSGGTPRVGSETRVTASGVYYLVRAG